MIIIFTAAAYTQDKHAITIDDLWNMKRIGSYDIAPNGSKIIFDLSSYNMEDNKGKTNIWMINSDGTNLTIINKEPHPPNF